MRITLTLENPRHEVRIPLHYNYLLASCIYRTLATSSSSYAERLHQEGYPFQGKHFKPFTFSQLLVARRQIQGDQLLIQSPTLRWCIASPVDEFVMHFANGILERGQVRLGDAVFRVRDAQALPAPTFTPAMRFTCLSPISVSTHTDKAGLHPLQYCRLEGNFYDKVVENLRHKYTLLTGHDARHLNLTMAFDPAYIARRDGRIHKLIHYKETRIFAYLAPFTVEGDVELIRVGYECGFGDGNSKGLGMAEVNTGRRGIVQLELTLTGNPWSDWGVVSFCRALMDASPAFLDGGPLWTEQAVTIRLLDAAPRQDVEVWLAELLRTRWNKLYWPSRAAKALGRVLVFDREGFVDTGRTFPLTKEQKEQVKEKIGTIQLKDEVRVAQERLTYIGVPKDARTLRAELQHIAAEFIASQTVIQGSSRTCDLCGRASTVLHPVTQSVNPLLNKHHNSKVRGAMGSNGYFDICPVCRLTNLFATLEPSIPFVYISGKQETLLLLPDIPGLDLLRRIAQRLDENLWDLSRPNALRTSTNLREVRAHDEWSLALVVFHNIFYKFSTPNQDDSDGEWSWNPTFDEQREVPRLTRWLILPFAKPQNVRFGNIHAVEIDHRLYDYVKPLPFNNEMDLQLVPDIIKHLVKLCRSGQRYKRLPATQAQVFLVVYRSFWYLSSTVDTRLPRGTRNVKPVGASRL